jgi:beta propeller repeat protein
VEAIRRRTLALTLAVALAIALVGAQAALGALQWTERRLTAEPADEYRASIWGDLVVYELWTGLSEDVFMRDLATGQVTPIAVHPASQIFPRIYGDTIVWYDDRNHQAVPGAPYWDIYAYDLSSGTEMRITDEAVSQADPAIHGTNIVWADLRAPGNGNDIWRYDLVDGTEHPVIQGVAHQYYPDIFGERIVYQTSDTPSGNTDIYLHDLADGSTRRITDETANAAHTAWQYRPRLWGDQIVWEDSRHHGGGSGGPFDVYAHDLVPGTEHRITDEPVDQTLPSVSRDVITWEDSRNHWAAPGGPYPDIYAHDLSDGSEWRITDEAAFQEQPGIWASKLVWEDRRDGAQKDIWAADLELTVDRSGGPTRYGTAALISQNHFASAGTVVLATGAMFPDALSASGLAGCYGGPLLLTLPDQLMPQARDEIVRLGATDVVIVGGEGAVSAEVAAALQGMGLNVSRIGGEDRFHTSTLIAAEVERMTGARFEQTAFVARGDEFPDALAVSPLAYYHRFPILLTPPDALNSRTEAALRDLDIETAVVAGGPGAVSEGVKNAVDGVLAGNGGTPSERWAGPTRYETAVEVARRGSDAYWAGTGFIGLAVGDNFPDALAGGCAAGREFGVLLLTPTNDLPVAAEGFINDVKNGVGWVEAFGGADVVSDAVASEVLQLLP